MGTATRRRVRKEYEGALRCLAPYERRIIEMRLGLLDDQEHDVKDVAEQMHLTVDQVQFIEIRALRKLRWGHGTADAADSPGTEPRNQRGTSESEATLVTKGQDDKS